MATIWRSLEEVPGDLGRTVVTVGNFDGVHLGHQHVIRRAGEVAGELGLDRVVAVTFDPHPIAVLRPEHAPPTLTTISRRLELLGDAGVTDVLVVPFSREIAAWPPERFVEEILVGGLHARAVVVGANFRFGNRASGDVALLERMGADLGFATEGIALDGGPQVWSSTYVRNCLAAGDVEGAGEALGHHYTVRGKVARGDARGVALGYPTANVPTAGLNAAPGDGVYAGWLRRLDHPDATRMPAAISVGSNPTFEGERERRVEAYVLDHTDLDLYDADVEVGFVSRIRGMHRFDTVDALREAMAEDVRRTREVMQAAPAD
jgi:riboflavin kinase/FMN adenylyltransferase